MSVTRGAFLRGLLAAPFIPAFVKESAADELFPEPKPEPVQAIRSEVFDVQWLAPITRGGRILYDLAGPVEELWISRPGALECRRSFEAPWAFAAHGAAIGATFFGEECIREKSFNLTKYLQPGDLLELNYTLTFDGWSD